MRQIIFVCAPTLLLYLSLNVLPATLDPFDLSTLLLSLPLMVVPARLNPPPVFTGKRDGFTALAWLLALNRYFTLAKVQASERTPHAISYLESPGPARWFDGCGLADTCNFETEFTPTFKKEYIPHNFAGACRRALTNLRMTSDFPTFLTTFKDLLGALLGFAANDSAKDTVNEFAQTSFIDNCPLALQQLIEGHILQHPTISLPELFQYATEMDRIYSFKPNSSTVNSAPLVSSLLSPPSHSQATPMELDHLTVTLNNMNRRLNQWEKNVGRNNRHYQNNNYNSSHPPTLTPNERDWCRRNGACFRCRQPGHLSDKCPIYKNSSNNNRNDNHNGKWVYQVTVGDSPESGKASGNQV